MSKLVWAAAGALTGAFWLSKRQNRDVDLTGQVVLVTGGSRGLGFALAMEFARLGCRVAICARDGAELQRAAERISAAGGNVRTFPCDLRDAKQARTMMRSVIAEMSGLDILVNNAGLIQVGPAQSMLQQDFEAALDLMFWAPFHCIAEALPHFRTKRAGRIVNIASVGGLVSVPHLLPYCAAKFALVGLSDGLATELAPENIHVTTVAPGLMRTGSHIQAEFRGQHNREYRWFGLAASLPLLTMNPDHAARRIVRAVRQERTRLTLPLSASILAQLNAFAPELLAAALKLANTVLPEAPEGASGKVKGRDIGHAAVDAVGSSAVRGFQNEAA